MSDSLFSVELDHTQTTSMSRSVFEDVLLDIRKRAESIGIDRIEWRLIISPDDDGKVVEDE